MVSVVMVEDTAEDTAEVTAEAEAEADAVMGQMVVVTGTTEVTTWVERAGQYSTVAAQLVTVNLLVE